MGKIDIHLHLGPEEIKQSQRRAGEKVTYATGNIPHEPVMKMSSAGDMVPHLEELGISKGIILSGGEEDGRMDNEKAKKAAEAVPGVYAWMCNLSERDPETVEQRLRTYKNQGAVGVGEFAVNQWIGSPFIEAVFTAAETLSMPVLFHMSPEEGFNYGVADRPGLPLLEEALKKHPRMIFIGHSQPFWHEITGDAKADRISRNSWGEGPVADGGRLVYLLDTYLNLYCDLSANSGGHAIMRDEAFGLRFLEKFQDRLMFGTDMCSVDMVFPLGRWLDEKLEEGRLDKEVYDKICVKNAERIFGVW
ncbi:MAG: amidohydrolase family protein [Hungatella sp.]|nr:amidohydrolase family protein [Hungatella sp.]